MVFEDKLIILTNQNLFILNKNNGSRILKIPISSTLKPIVSGKTIFLITENNLLVSINLESGKILYSLKINDEQNSFYCFGCGAKGDIFTIYTDLYNYTFPDAVKDLAERAGINIEYQTQQQSFQQNNIFKILNITCEWFQKNLYKENTSICLKYLKSRKINDDTISKFKLGYSYNTEETLFDFLKKNSLQ